ncbi:MAG: ABC transporter permease [Lachnospiraceae bacterium]|nr:ABC transporter permease [Lachnospiraceae bacterium]
MLVFENIMLALSGLKANKTRSILTMLGIIIGIASVIAIMTIGTSLTQSVEHQMAEMGATNITLGIQQKRSEEEESDSGMMFNRGPWRKELTDDDYLTGEDLDDIVSHFSGEIEGVLKVNELGNSKLKNRNNTADIRVSGMNDRNLENEKLEMLAGRIFTSRDQEQKKKVILLSDRAVDDALKVSYEEALGQIVTVVRENKFYHYTLVGVYRYDDSNSMYSFSYDESTTAYIPILTSFNDAHTPERYSNLDLVCESSTNIDDLVTQIESYVNKRYYRNNKSFEASCYSMSSMVESYTSMLSSISLAISVIAGISLLVGGIGVMNIMLVSIQERTREIGTRKALGAKNSSIRMQFIVEAIVLCIVGGAIGIIIGIIAGYFATPLVDEEAEFFLPVNGIFLSVGFSVAVGVFFGYYPANKAAKMNPIDALRYE